MKDFRSVKVSVFSNSGYTLESYGEKEKNADTWASPPKRQFYWPGVGLDMGILVYKALPVKLSSLYGVRQGGIPKRASAHQRLCKANFHSARQNGKNEDGGMVE